MNIVVVGSVAYDSVETPFGSRDRILGGSATYFSVCASQFTDVGLVAVVGDDFATSDRSMLEQRGIDLDGLVTEAGSTFHWKGRYEGDMNEAQTLDTRLNVFENFQPQLPVPYRNVPVLFLANIDPVLQASVLAQMNKPALVACDTMNFWIEGKRDALIELLTGVDVLLINEAETKLLAGETNVVRAARTVVQGMGPSRIVVKRGEYGVFMYGPQGACSAPAYPLENVVDPTGAGDTFAGGFIGSLAEDGSYDEPAFRRALAYGTVMASFTVEDFSLEKLKRLDRDQIDKRFDHYMSTISL